MANIGSLNFTVDANTDGLRRAIKRLKDYETSTNNMAKSTKKGSQTAANAMARQEQAIRKAFMQLKNYQKTVNESKKSDDEKAKHLHEVEEAFQLLTRQMTNSTMKLHNFNRANQTFEQTMGRSRRELTAKTKAVVDGSSRLAKYNILLRDLESSAVLALGPLSGLGARIRSISAIVARGLGGFKWYTIALVAGSALMVIALSKLVASAVRAGSEMKSLQLRFEAATGSLSMGNRRLYETIDLAKSLGLEVGVLTKSYSRFVAASQGTSLEGEKTRKIFTQVAQAAAALKLNGSELEGVMRALEQMLSKGTIQAEELRGQLGDRLPGAFRIMAQAMGVSTRELGKMMKAGDLISEEALPKFGDTVESIYGDKAVKNINTLSGALNNLKTEFFEFSAQVNKTPGFLVLSPESKSNWASFSGWVTISVQAMGMLVNAFSFGEEAARDQALAVEEVTEALKEYRTTAAGAIIEVTEQNALGPKFKEAKDMIEEANAALYIHGQALALITETGSKEKPQFLIDYFEALAKLKEFPLKQSDLDDLATGLSDVLTSEGDPIAVVASLEGIAKAQALVIERNQEAVDELERLGDIESLGKLNKQFDDLAEEIAIFKLGPEAFEVWEKATMPAREYGEAVFEAGASVAEAELAQMRYNRLLREYIIIQKDADDAEKAKKDSSKRFEKMAKALVGAWREIETLSDKLAALREGPRSLKIFEEIQGPIQAMGRKLIDAGNNAVVVTATLAALEDVLWGIMRANEAIELDELAQELRDIKEETAAMAMGVEAFEVWKTVTKPAKEYSDAVYEIKENTELAAKAQRDMTEALLAQLAAAKQLAAEEKAKKDAERQILRQAKGLRKVVFEMDQLQIRLAAMAKGPESFELFTKVQEPLAKMRRDLLDLGWEMNVVNIYMARYEELLMKQFEMTDKWARANQRVADAIVSGLESVILEGESVKDMLHELAQELLRVALNAVFLDKLKTNLFNLFQGGAFPGVLSGGGGVTAPGGGGVPDFSGFAAGGSFKLTGSGGSDSVPFFGMGKAGETVSVARADQLAGGGGGGGVIINQYNTFENIADPSTILPMLEANNRQLKGEILEGLDRGTL